MTKDEYLKTLEKHMAKVADAIQDDYYTGYFDGLKYAVDLAEKLDEPKKVVIPQFIAEWIEEAKIYSDNEVDPLGIIYWMDDCNGSEPRYKWLKNIDNQKLLLNAIANGYEVEKETKYLVRVKGFKNHNEYYINYDCGDEIICLDDKYERNNFKTIFTKSWLKANWPEYDAYNNAGLLEFEEVSE